MDHRKRKWIDANNWHEYIDGINEFLEFAFRNNGEKVPCQCKKCVNRFHRSKEEIFDHLIEHRMIEDYEIWSWGITTCTKYDNNFECKPRS